MSWLPSQADLESPYNCEGYLFHLGHIKGMHSDAGKIDKGKIIYANGKQNLANMFLLVSVYVSTLVFDLWFIEGELSYC